MLHGVSKGFRPPHPRPPPVSQRFAPRRHRGHRHRPAPGRVRGGPKQCSHMSPLFGTRKIEQCHIMIIIFRIIHVPGNILYNNYFSADTRILVTNWKLASPLVRAELTVANSPPPPRGVAEFLRCLFLLIHDPITLRTADHTFFLTYNQFTIMTVLQPKIIITRFQAVIFFTINQSRREPPSRKQPAHHPRFVRLNVIWLLFPFPRLRIFDCLKMLSGRNRVVLWGGDGWGYAQQLACRLVPSWGLREIRGYLTK